MSDYLLLCGLHGAHQAPPSMEFSRQEYWSGLPCPSAWDLPDLGIELGFLALQADSLPSEAPADFSFSGYHKPIQIQQDLWTPSLDKKNVNQLGDHVLKWEWELHMCMCLLSPSVVSKPATPCTVAHPWDFPGNNTRMDCHFLLQGIFPTQGSNSHLPRLLHWQVDFFHWATWEAQTPPFTAVKFHNAKAKVIQREENANSFVLSKYNGKKISLPEAIASETQGAKDRGGKLSTLW